ncbi:MAG: hypothetical protein Q9179_007265 [Wetmoreana sp. 5 TL-2023]
MTKRSESLSPTETLILLVESVYAAAEKVHEGGRSATDPVDIFQHKTPHVQLQVEGFHSDLEPWTLAQIFKGMSEFGSRIGELAGKNGNVDGEPR